MAGIKSLFDLVERIKQLPDDVQNRCANVFTIHSIEDFDELNEIQKVLGVTCDPSASDPRRMCAAYNVGGSSVIIYLHTTFDMLGDVSMESIVSDVVHKLQSQGLTVKQIRSRLNEIIPS